jgi:hypothetical protein
MLNCNFIVFVGFCDYILFLMTVTQAAAIMCQDIQPYRNQVSGWSATRNFSSLEKTGKTGKKGPPINIMAGQ